ncbi:heterodisulfide reductase subunit B, partial [archaeon]|nr:heterodisulfide reductase subunit B [archaeon]
LHATAKEYDQSVKAVCAALGIELKEVEDWSCCGATAAHSTNYKLSVALPARDLISAEKDAMDVMVPCAACFNRFKSAQHSLKEDEELRKEIEKVVGRQYKGSVAIRNPIDIFANDIGLDTMKSKVKRPLKGLKPVAYYGCLLLRPPEVCQFDDYENPVLLDKMMASLGAEPKQWSYKTDCCGGSLSISRTDIVVKMADKFMAMAREAGANCIVVACPLCMANLDMRASKNGRIPVFYFTELIGIALGLNGTREWLKLHNIDSAPMMTGLGLL